MEVKHCYVPTMNNYSVTLNKGGDNNHAKILFIKFVEKAS